MERHDSDWDRRGRTDRQDTEGGNGSGTAGVVGRAGWVGTGVDWDGQSSGAGRHGTKKISTSVYIGRVCVGVWAVLPGEVRVTDRGCYV